MNLEQSSPKWRPNKRIKVVKVLKWLETVARIKMLGWLCFNEIQANHGIILEFFFIST